MAFRAGNLDQIDVGQSRRIRQDRLGNRNLVVVRKALNNPDRSVLDQRQARAQLLARPGLDPLNEECKDLFEHQDLIFAESIGAGEKQIGHPRERFGAYVGRAAVRRTFKFGNERVLAPAPSRSGLPFWLIDSEVFAVGWIEQLVVDNR